MTEIFVVCKQDGNFNLGLIPVAAYGDYLSALFFAKTLFIPGFSIETNSARDLVFPVVMTASVAATATTSGTAIPTTPVTPVSSS